MPERSSKQASAGADALREAYNAYANATLDPSAVDNYEQRAWVRDVRVDPNELIVEQKGSLYRVAWSGSDGAFTFGERTEVAVQYVDVAKAEGSKPAPDASVDVERVADLWKAQTADQQIVYGVVMQPGLPDSQGDTVTADEIEKAAHRWLVDSRRSDVQHNGVAAKVDVVESYVLKQDALVEGRMVHTGSWVVAVKVDDDLWGRITKGELTGFSIGGSALRTPDLQPAGAT